MSTRRERLERKVEKRGEWAGKAKARSEAAFATAHERAQAIPFGQPILIGHHSERRDRNYRAKIGAGFDKAAAESAKAKHHERKADGLASALERSIFDDDPDAIERLREKAEALDASREHMKAANAAWKKGGWPAVVAVLGEAMAAEVQSRTRFTGVQRPFPSYSLSNTGAELRRCLQRIKVIEAKRARAAEAEALGGVVVKRHPEINYCRVTFADKPDRAVLVALRDAGYRWGDGSWQGRLSKLPEEVEALESEQNDQRKAAAGKCLCSDADAYECAKCETEREAIEPESFEPLSFAVGGESGDRVVRVA